MAQQKQRKQLHLTDDENIFTYCFQSIQRLQRNSKTYAIRNYDNPKRRQPKIKDIHTATTTYTTQFYQSYIANNKPNKHNPNNQNNDTNVGFTTNTKLVPSQLRQRKFWSIHIQILTNFKTFIFKQFRTFRPSLICTFHRSRKICTWIDEQFCTFHPSLHESVAFLSNQTNNQSKRVQVRNRAIKRYSKRWIQKWKQTLT